MLCIGPPPNLTVNCLLPVAARSRPQCRAGVHARRSSLASPHRAANRRLRRFTICPRRPPFPAIPASAAPSPPQTSKASPARGGAAAGGGGVPHRALPIPSRLAAHAPPPPNLTANCRLSVAARSRPQCRAGVHARRSSLASPHRAANRRLRRFTICPRRPPFPAIPASAAPSPPQTSKASPARGGAAAGGGGVPHLAPPIPFRVAAFPRHRTPCTDPRRFATCLPLPRRKTKTAARLFAGPRSPRVFFHCLRRRARMVRRGLPCYASPPSSRRINGTTSLGWMSSTSANSVYSIFSASRIAASSKPESRLPTACRFFLKS